MELVQSCAVSAASVAAVIDVASRRIPNWLTFGTFLTGILINTVVNGPSGAFSGILGALLGAALLLPFYVTGGIGAGDVKLLAALGALVGPTLLVSVAMYGAVAGGAMSVVILLMRGRLFLTLNEVLVQHRAPSLSGAKAPYGIAIASGVYLSVVLPHVLG